ncbi:MAG: hypothetical protein ABI091_05970 [Ferruginibacter sp.]
MNRQTSLIGILLGFFLLYIFFSSKQLSLLRKEKTVTVVKHDTINSFLNPETTIITRHDTFYSIPKEKVNIVRVHDTTHYSYSLLKFQKYFNYTDGFMDSLLYELPGAIVISTSHEFALDFSNNTAKTLSDSDIKDIKRIVRSDWKIRSN